MDFSFYVREAEAGVVITESVDSVALEIALETVPEGLVAVLNVRDNVLLPWFDGWHELVLLVVEADDEVELTLSLSESGAWAFAPPTIPPITVNTTRPTTAYPLFVYQKGWRLEVTANFSGSLGSLPLKFALLLSVFGDKRKVTVTQMKFR